MARPTIFTFDICYCDGCLDAGFDPVEPTAICEIDANDDGIHQVLSAKCSQCESEIEEAVVIDEYWEDQHRQAEQADEDAQGL